jgi:hypothetical protein
MRADGIRPYKNTLCDFRSNDRIISENGAFFAKPSPIFVGEDSILPRIHTKITISGQPIQWQ